MDTNVNGRSADVRRVVARNLFASRRRQDFLIEGALRTLKVTQVKKKLPESKMNSDRRSERRDVQTLSQRGCSRAAEGLLGAWAGGVRQTLEMLAHTFHLIQRFALYL